MKVVHSTIEENLPTAALLKTKNVKLPFFSMHSVDAGNSTSRTPNDLKFVEDNNHH